LGGGEGGRRGSSGAPDPAAPATSTDSDEATEAAAPASRKPIGISPVEPKKSTLTTRERSRSGTSSIRIVTQIVLAKPQQSPRASAEREASQYQGATAITITSAALAVQSRELSRPRPPCSASCAQARAH